MVPEPNNKTKDIHATLIKGLDLPQQARVIPPIAPPTGNANNHELVMQQTRRAPTLNDIIEQRRHIGGRVQADQLKHELFTASQLNRGPPGTFSSSNLHMELLLGTDERIGFDYLAEL